MWYSIKYGINYIFLSIIIICLCHFLFTSLSDIFKKDISVLELRLPDTSKSITSGPDTSKTDSIEMAKILTHLREDERDHDELVNYTKDKLKGLNT
jgi:hypothetical protein